jgi:hypothetical protein
MSQSTILVKLERLEQEQLELQQQQNDPIWQIRHSQYQSIGGGYTEQEWDSEAVESFEALESLEKEIENLYKQIEKTL